MHAQGASLSAELAPPQPAAAGFEEFYRRELEWARRLAFVLSADASVGDDLVQEAFTRLYKRYADLDNPRGYLRVVLVNLHRGHVRRSGRERRLRPVADAPALDRTTVDMLDLIDALPARQRAVLVLRYFEDLSEAEIAETLGCRPGTVKSLASRALAQLREELDR